MCGWVHISLIINRTHSAHMTKTAAISVRVSDRVKEAAAKAAADDSRSLASLVEKVLVEFLKARGYLRK